MSSSDREQGFDHPESIKKIAYNIFELGHGYKTCARVLDLSVYTVREWYAQYKLGLYKPESLGGRHLKKYSAAFREKVVKDYLETKPSITELAKRHEVSKRTARRWIDEYEKALKTV